MSSEAKGCYPQPRHVADLTGGLMRAFLRVAIVPALILTLAPSADAGLCTKRSGKVVFRQGECKARESPLDLAAFVPQGAKGDAGAPGRAQPRLRAVDANGQQLPGILNEFGELLYVLGSHVFGIPLYTDAFGPGVAAFDAIDCTGPPLLFANDDAFYLKGYVDGTTAYYADGLFMTRVIQSIRFGSTALECTGTGRTYDAAAGYCCSNGTTSILAVAASAVDLSGFVPPFRVEVDE
ncbi:MAG TPA: hypothetical protein VGR62_18080 [Candidatus Binatia bacterium]|nr:hypothetical protein [Candidatus Binatia bacterium]